MTDQHTSHLISEYIDNELSPQKRSIVDKHIEKCLKCREELEKALRLKTVLSEIKSPDPGEGYFDDLSARIGSLTFHKPAPSVVTDARGGRFRSEQAILKSLIRLAAVITLLFVSFYISDTAGNGENDHWAGTIPDSDYVEDDTFRFSEEPSRTQGGISRTSSRFSSETDSGKPSKYK